MLLLSDTPDPYGVPLLMDILPKLAKLQFEDVDTHKKVGLERKNYMVMLPAMPPEPQMVFPMQWA